MDSVTRALLNEFSETSGLNSLPEDKKFEHFAAFSVVSSRYSEDFDTADLVSGEGNDLNIDAFAVKINGRIANDADFVDDVLNLNGYLDVEFIIIQAKTSSSFDGSAIIALGDNLANEVFSEHQSLPVNEDVKRLIKIKDRILENASRLKDNPVCRVYYVCTGTWTEDTYLVEAIKRKRKDLLETNIFSNVHFEPIGARSLQQLFRATRTSISRTIKFERQINLPEIHDVKAAHIGILPVTEFLKLITDDEGELIKSVFVDNVRDFQGQNPVNQDIAKTIEDGDFDQFALRNNGVTIVTRSIKTSSVNYQLEDFQIVNGCQTSHVIYNNKEKIQGELYIPIKIIHTESDDVSQNIIRSTNKQTQVEDNDLLALTQFQRDLEDYYSGRPEEIKLYYERRAKQYASEAGLEKGRITTIGSQLKSYASMFLEYPNQASRYQGTLLKTVKSQVFQPNHKPEPYFTSALAAYRFEVAIRRLSVEERSIRPFRYYILLAFRHRFEDREYPGAANSKVAVYCENLIQKLGTTEKARESFDKCANIVREALNNLGLTFERDSAKSRPLIDEVRRLSRNYNQSIAD